ncbi:DUF397 domain-containing protein [Streptomyces gardneri]|uniref:DUF397 domain-containing protein n=1 Tax=Nocardia sputi TaxID=2943705 RepID=UPI001895E4FF|nr:DUF397 domain-containing protein [Nocardia sputi]MBF6165686.1 DUF397 domain-containing protein [Streptomyces gardneri]
MNVDPSTALWFKSSHSSSDKECVEVAFLAPDLVGMRDSKNPAAPALVFTASEWDTLTARITRGELDRSQF